MIRWLCLLCLSGCYFTFGTKPGGPGEPCTTSRALPIADTVIAAEGAFGLAFGTWALIAIKDDGSLSAGEGKSTAALLAIVGAGMLIPHALSARAGFRHTAACRRQRARPTTLPPGYDLPPPPDQRNGF